MAYNEKIITSLLAEPGSQRKAFEEIVRHYSQPLYWKIRNIVLSHDDADDVLQNTFVKAWVNLPEFRNMSKISTWLYRIAINESLDFLRRKKHVQDLSVDEVASVANTLMADEYFDGDQAQAMLYEAIDATDFYRGHAEKESRSIMNVTFNLPTKELEAEFIAQAAEKGFKGLKGHRSVGGCRASIYNAFPVEGAEKLAQFMADFARAH